MRFKTLVCLSIASQVLPALGQDPKVIVVGTQTDTEARRDFIAGTIVIGRKRIEDSGVRNVEQLLKREPAVTVRDGSISLLNMPGYTQVLVDGQEPQGGRSAVDLDLVHVERIEIIKSSGAQYGPFGMAGTINIITRTTRRTTSTTLSTGDEVGGGGEINLALSHNQSTAGSPLRYSLEISASREDDLRDSRLRQTLNQNGSAERDHWKAPVSEDSRTTALTASGNVTWQTGSAGLISLSPDIVKTGSEDVHAESRRWENGSTLTARETSDSTIESLSLPLKWTFKPTKKSQLELFAFAYMSRMNTDETRIDAASNTQRDVRFSVQRAKMESKKLDLTYKASVDGGHAIKAGTSYFRGKNDADYDHLINGEQDAALNGLGNSRLSRFEQHRLYLQDEWRISESLAGTLGISGAQNSIDVDEKNHVVGARFRMWSPSLHVAKKVGTDDKRQFRLSLARSFKAQSEQDVTQRPTINPLAPCLDTGICPRNTVDTADTSGNLQLRPERAIGLNVSYEHGIGDDGQLTVEVFTRRIAGKHGSQILLEHVPWAIAQRYVSRPGNLGDARSTGINVEMELALREVVKGAPEVNLRGSVGLARSRVSSLPGPDNHLDKQTPWTAKLGGTYGMKSAPIKFDIDVNWSPGQWTRTSLSERIFIPRNFECDASMIWSVNQDSRLVLGLETKYPGTHRLINEYSANDEVIRLHTSEKKSARLKLQFDTKL